MHTLHIALQDGFRQHSVVVTVDGRTIYDRQDVTTDLRISRADAVDTEVPQSVVRIDVTVQPGPITATREHDVQASPYLAISLDGGQLRFTASNEVFRYL